MAKKAVKKAAATKAPAKKVAAKKTGATKKVARKKSAAKKVAPKKTVRAGVGSPTPVAASPASSAASDTVVVAKCDLGFGNELYVRGQGPGLSWDRGTLMKNAGPDEWVWKTSETGSDFEIKFLTNDVNWSAGENFKVKAGTKAVFVPAFG
jgi:hypothetical protein